MKLQYLSIIFLIIILPIILVLSVYVDYHIDAINQKHTYDTKLLDATYDAIKSYQLNTVNNAISDISASKIGELEAAVKTFYNSLSNTFGYTGYKSSVMEEYVPAVVFTMYDGYYIYSPYRNVLTGVPSTTGVDSDGDGVYDPNVDEDYKNDTILENIKPYVYYSCRYKKDTGAPSEKFDIVITYTLDNYITIQGTIGGKYVNKYGYLVDDIVSYSDDFYLYENVLINDSTTEELKEYLGDKEYSYAKINGTKYYLDEEEKEVFYINSLGKRTLQASEAQKKETYVKYQNFIKNNNSAYRYARDAYKFTTWVRKNLSGLTSEYAVDEEGNTINSFTNYTIFGQDPDQDDNKTSGPDLDKLIQYDKSDFNLHRAEVIRYTIEKNLSAAIAGYNNYFKNSESKFIMPNISETDWEVIENNVSMITFLQGFKIGGRDYNEYSVVANSLTKEYIDENDIYIVCDNKTYYKPNDKELISENKGIKYGVWDLNCERRIDATGDDEIVYYPISYAAGKPYLGSYSSVIASTSVDNAEQDMYKYMRKINEDSEGIIDDHIEGSLLVNYHMALARERYSQYSVNNDVDLESSISPIPIPDGFVLSPDSPPSETRGMIIEDSEGNQYVWIPVFTKDEYDWGVDYSAVTSENDYTNIANALKAYTGTYSNSSYSDQWYDGNGGMTETEYNKLYKNMLKSIYKNGGFYIGRYEMGIGVVNSTEQAKNITRKSTSAPPSTSPLSKANAVGYNHVTQAQAQGLAKKLGQKAGYSQVSTSIMFGLQWKAVCVFIEKFDMNNTAPIKSDWVKNNTYSKLWGNYKNSSFRLNRGYYTTTYNNSTVTWNQNYTTSKGTTTSWLCTTGASDQNSSLNIYDFGGNLSEWTLEKYLGDSNKPCTILGGSLLGTPTGNPNNRNYAATSEKTYYRSSRVSLILN